MPGVLISITNVNKPQLDFAEIAAQKLLAVVNDQEFLHEVYTAPYKRSKFRLDDRGMHYIEADNTKILNQIITGKEFRTPPDNIINLQVTLGATKKNVIGYVAPLIH